MPFLRHFSPVTGPEMGCAAVTEHAPPVVSRRFERSPEAISRRMAELDHIADLGLPPDRLVAALVGQIRPILPFDQFVFWATDPSTGLPTRVLGTEAMSSPELRAAATDEVRRWVARDAGGSGRVAGAVQRSTAQAGHQVRLTITSGTILWGAALFRRAHRPFAPSEMRWLETVGRAAADGFRSAVRKAPSSPALGRGVLVLDEKGLLRLADGGAAALLEGLADRVPKEPAGSLPLAVHAVAVLSRLGGSGAGARLVVGNRDGAWLAVSGSVLRATAAQPAHYAITIEPAKPRETAPMMLAAVELSQRQQEVAQLIAQGIATREIARRLFLSEYTVRDYVKTIFEKVGVNSRGELVARLFACGPQLMERAG
jgi:DNA-binding CsgD family transcriptional regulator